MNTYIAKRYGIIPASVDWMVYVSRVNHRN